MPFFLMPWSLVDPLSSTPGHSSSLTDHSGILLPVSFKLSAETSTACLILRLYQLVAHSGLLCENEALQLLTWRLPTLLECWLLELSPPSVWLVLQS